jgi:hypothetical protein
MKAANKQNGNNTNNILQFYTPANNEKLVEIENFSGYSYKVYAVYVNGEYDRRIKIKKY